MNQERSYPVSLNPSNRFINAVTVLLPILFLISIPIGYLWNMASEEVLLPMLPLQAIGAASLRCYAALQGGLYPQLGMLFRSALSPDPDGVYMLASLGAYVMPFLLAVPLLANLLRKRQPLLFLIAAMIPFILDFALAVVRSYTVAAVLDALMLVLLLYIHICRRHRENVKN